MEERRWLGWPTQQKHLNWLSRVCVCVCVCVCARACVSIDQSRDKIHHVDENFVLIHYLSLLLELSLGEEYIVGPSPPSAPPV